MNISSSVKKTLAASSLALLVATASYSAVTQLVPASPAVAQTLSNGAPAAGFADLVEQVMPAVISVEVEFQPASFENEDVPSMDQFPQSSPFRHFFEQFRSDRQHSPRRAPRGRGQGSGFIISEDGYAVTNNHVVDGAARVNIKLHDGKSYKARVVGTDSKTDLALLKIESDKRFQAAKFAKEPARVGDWVVAVGNPFGLGGTVTTGVVSAQGRNIGSGPYDDYLQIDASINRGNSGGPAFNLKGEVIGVNTAIFSPSGGSVGIGFAIPAALTQSVVDDLKDDGAVTRGWLGVQIQSVTEDIADSLGLAEARGAIVAEVTNGSPADLGGIKTGDTIIEVNGNKVDNPRDLALKVSKIKPGSNSEVTVLRRGKERKLKLEIGEMPSGKRQAALQRGNASGDTLGDLGLRLSANEDGEGVVVTGVKRDSAAAKAGLRRGDVIVEIANNLVEEPEDVAELLQSAAQDGKSRALLLVKSGERQRFVTLSTGKS